MAPFRQHDEYACFLVYMDCNISRQLERARNSYQYIEFIVSSLKQNSRYSCCRQYINSNFLNGKQDTSEYKVLERTWTVCMDLFASFPELSGQSALETGCQTAGFLQCSNCNVEMWFPRPLVCVPKGDKVLQHIKAHGNTTQLASEMNALDMFSLPEN